MFLDSAKVWKRRATETDDAVSVLVGSTFRLYKSALNYRAMWDYNFGRKSAAHMLKTQQGDHSDSTFHVDGKSVLYCKRGLPYQYVSLLETDPDLKRTQSSSDDDDDDTIHNIEWKKQQQARRHHVSTVTLTTGSPRDPTPCIWVFLTPKPDPVVFRRTMKALCRWKYRPVLEKLL